MVVGHQDVCLGHRGAQARERGLVDEFGGIREAIADAALYRGKKAGRNRVEVAP